MRRKNTNSVDPSRRQLGMPQRETTTTKVMMGSPEANNVTECIRKTNFDGNFSDKYWRTEQIELVKNDRMQKNYDAFKNELKILGRKTEDLDDVLVFSAETEKSCREISVEGRKVCLRKRHVLGYTGSGVHLVRNFDILTRYMAYQQYSSPSYIMVYKAFLGKAKPIVPRLHKEDNYVSPWCGFDCHVSARRIEPDMPICEALNCSYVFFYEYDDISSNTIAFPRQILPYAVLHLTRKHTLGMESPFLCVARDYNCKPVEVKGETRRGFRFTYSKHNKQIKPPKLNVDKQKLIQNSLKEQLLEMRTKGDSRTTPPALEKNAIESSKQTMGNERLSKLSPPTLLKCDPVTVNFKGERFCVSPVISDKMIKLKQGKMFCNLETKEDVNNEKDKLKHESLNVRRLPRSMKPVVSLKRLHTDTKYRTKKSIILSEWCSQSVNTSACVEKVNVQSQQVNQQEDTLKEKVNVETQNVNQQEDTLKVIQRFSATEENKSIQKDRTNMESCSEIRSDKHSNIPKDTKDKTEYKENQLEINKRSKESGKKSEDSPQNTGNKAVAIDTIHILSTMKEMRSSGATLEDKIQNVSVNSKSVDVYTFTDSEENYDTDERNSREKTSTKERHTLKSSRVSPLKSLKDRSLSRERDPMSTPQMFNKTISEKVLSSSNEMKGKRKDTSKLKQCETEKGRKVGLTKEVVCNRDSKQVQNHIEMAKPKEGAASSDNLIENEITTLTSMSQSQTIRISSPKVENPPPATLKSVSHVNIDQINQNEPKTTQKESEISPFSRKEETFKNDSLSKDASGKFKYYSERAKTQTPKTIKDLFQEPLKFQLIEKMKSNPRLENVRLPVDIKLTTHAGLTKTTSPPAGVIAPAQLDCSPRVASANTSQSNFYGHQPTPVMTFNNNNIQRQDFRQITCPNNIPVIPPPIRENATDRIQSLVGYRFQKNKQKTLPIHQTKSENETKQSHVDQKCIPLTVLDCQEKEEKGRTLGKFQSYNTLSKVHNHKSSLHDKHTQKHAPFSQSKSLSAGCQTTSSATRDGMKPNRDMGMHLAKPRISPRDPRIAKQNTSNKTQNNSTPVDIPRKDNDTLLEPTLSEKPNQKSTKPAKTSPSSDSADKPSITTGQPRGKNNLGIDYNTAQKLQRVLRQHISEVNKHRSPVTTEAGIKVSSDRLDTSTVTHISEAKEKGKQPEILVIASPKMQDFLYKNLASPDKNVASDKRKTMDNIQTPDRHNVMIEHFDNDSQDTVIGGLELSPSRQDISTESQIATRKENLLKDQIMQNVSGPSTNNQIEFSKHFKSLKNLSESGCEKEMEVDASNEVVLSSPTPVSLSDSNASCFIAEQDNTECNGSPKDETVCLDTLSVSPESEKCDKNDTKDSAQTHNNEGNKPPQKSTDPITDEPEQISTKGPVEKEKTVLPDSENNETDVTKIEHACIGPDRPSEFQEDGANPPVSIVKAEPLSIDDNVSKEEMLHTSVMDASDSNIDSESQVDEANPAVSVVEADSLKVEDNSATEDKLHTSRMDIVDSNISEDDDDDGPPDLTKGCCSSVFGNIHKLGKHDFPCGQSPKLCRSTIIDTLQELSYVLKVLNESSLNEGLNGNNIQNEKISLESISKAIGFQCLQEKGDEENDGNDKIKNDEQTQQEDSIALAIKKAEEKNESTRVETKVINEKPTISISSQATTTHKSVEVKSHPEAIERENAKDTDETLVSQNEPILSSEVKKEPIEMGDFDNLENLSDRAEMKRLEIVRVESNFILNIKKETCSSEETTVINNEPENKVRICDENRDTDVICENRFLNSFDRTAMSRNDSEINEARCDGQNDAIEEVLKFSPPPVEHKKEYSKQLPASNRNRSDQNSSTTIPIRDCDKTNNSSEANFSEPSKIGQAESQTVTHSSVDIQKGACNTSFPEKDETLNTLAKTSNDKDSIAVELNASKTKLLSEQKLFARRGTQSGPLLKEKAGILNRGMKGRKNMFDTRLSIQRMRAKLTSPMITSVMVEINEGPNHQNSSADKSDHALSLSEIDAFPNMSNHDLSNEKSKSFPDKTVGKGTVEPNQREPVEIAVVCEGTASATKQIENQEKDTAKNLDTDTHSNDKDVGPNMTTQISKGCENHQKGKRKDAKRDVIPFNAVMKKKKEQYLKYKHGLVWNKFIDYNEFRNELRGNKKTEDSDTQEPTDIYQRQPFFRPFHRNVEYHLNNQKHHTPFVPFQVKNYQKNRKPNSDDLCTADEESTRQFHNRSGNIGSKPVGNCNDADNESVDSYQPNRRQFQPFGGFRSFGFNHGKSGYFSWRRKYQTGPRYVGNERFYVTRKGVVQTEKEHREWKMFKERERIRIQIEGAVKDYRRTFEDSTDDMVGDEKVSKYLQSLTDKLDHIQNKRKLLHVQDQISDSNIAQKRSVESVESLPKQKDDHVEVKRLVSVDNIRDQFEKSLKSSEQRQREAPLVDALWRDHEGKSNQSEVLEKMLKEHFVKHLDNVTEKLKIELFAKLANETLGINAGEKRKTSSNQQHREVISKFVEKQLDVLRHSDEEKHNDRHHETQSTFGSESVRETSTDLEQYHEPDRIDYRHRRQRQYHTTKSKSPRASSSENISRGSRNNSDSRERYIPSRSYKRKRSYTRSRSRSRSRSSTPSRRFHSRDSHYWANKRNFEKKYHRKGSYDRRSRSRSKSRYRSRTKSRSRSLDRARWRSRSSDKRSFDQYSDSSDRRRFGSGSRTRSRSRSRSWSTERRERKKCFKDAYRNEDRFDYFDRGRENKYDNKEMPKGDSRSYSEDTFKRCLNDAFKSKWDDTTEDDPIIIPENTENEDSPRNQNVMQPSSKGNNNADKNVNRTVSSENDSEETSRPDRHRNTLRKNEPTKNPFRNNNADTSYDDNTDGDHYNDDNNQKIWKRFHRDDDRYNQNYKSRGRFTWRGFRGRGDFSRGRGNYRHGYRDDWNNSRGSRKHFNNDKRYSPERHRYRKHESTYSKYKGKGNYYGDKRKFMDDYDDDNCEYDDQGRYNNESNHYRLYTDRDNYADNRNDVIDLDDASYDDEGHQYDGQYYENRDSYLRDDNGGDFRSSQSRFNHKEAEQESNSKSPQPIPTIYTR